MWVFVGVLMLLVVGLSVNVLVNWWRFRRKELRAKQARCAPACSSLWPDSWLTVKSRNLIAVQSALSLHKPIPCSWLEGLANADRLFVAPPVKGWVLVTGAGLPSPSRDVDACFRFVLDLSQKLGQVQFFSANRGSQHHAWILARNGRIVRAYAWAGTTVWQQGAPTPVEAELGLNCFEYGEAPPGERFATSDLLGSNVEKVPFLAARWGLDPALIQRHFPLDEHGVAGKAAHRY